MTDQLYDSSVKCVIAIDLNVWSEFEISLCIYTMWDLCCTSHSVVSNSLWPHGLCVAHQVPLSMGFSKQEYWSGRPFPSPRDLPDPGIEPASPAWAGGFLSSGPLGKSSTLLLWGCLCYSAKLTGISFLCHNFLIFPAYTPNLQPFRDLLLYGTRSSLLFIFTLDSMDHNS